MIREGILPMGLNTALCCVGMELVPCWSFRSSQDIYAFSLEILKMKVGLLGTTEDLEILRAEIELLGIEESDLELFASQDEEFMLENNNTAHSAEEESE